MAVRGMPYIRNTGASVHPPLPLTPPGTSPGQVSAEPEPSAAESFGQLLTEAIQAINGAQAQADTAINRLASGEDVDLHRVMIAMEKADISFQLGLQVRTKVLEAYQEIMRMPL